MVETAFRFIIISIIIAIVIGLIGSVAFSWNLDTSTYLASLSAIFSIIAYILPIKQLAPIITLIISSMIFRVVVRIIRAIWELIPIAG